MNLRIAASVVFVGSLAYACGPQTRSDASLNLPVVSQQGFALASMGGVPAITTNAREKTLKSTSAELNTSFAIGQSAAGVSFSFSVKNSTAKNIEVNFPNGQAYDFVVVDSVGREVWRWADGRVFTQSVQNKFLGRGDSMSISEKWAPAKAGKYTAIAQLRSSNFPVEKRVEFERR